MSNRQSFVRWVTRPEMLVALSAVLIGICSLFVAVYQTALTREGHRAAVWPHLEVLPSVPLSGLGITVVNSGVGPARIEAASVKVFGERQPDWQHALSAVIGEPFMENVSWNVLNGRVMRPGEEYLILAATGDGPYTANLISTLRDQMYDGIMDVSVCYCSVSNECWVATMQEVIDRSRGISVSYDARGVRNCSRESVSGI